jgi:simple sugar transport system substrate-binding protein
MKKKSMIMAGVVTIAVMLGGCGGGGGGGDDAATGESDGENGAAARGTSIVATVPKQIGNNWFDSMDWEGEKWAEANGAEHHYIGPVDFDSAAQLQCLNDAIALQPDVLTVVPIAADACDELLKQAKEMGAAVVTHEGATLKNIDYNVDAFSNEDFGVNFAKKAAEIAGEDCVVALTVGQLTVPSHNAWSDAFWNYAQENYPNMTFINKVENGRAIPYESMDDSDESYRLGKELIQANPDLTMIFAGSASSTNGFCRAVRELNKIGSVYVIGIGEASSLLTEFEENSIQYAAFWYPGDAQYACYEVGKRFRASETIQSGDDLGAPGYEDIIVEGNLIFGKAWKDVTADNYLEMAEIL